MAQGKKYTIEYVKEVAKERGFLCLSNKYINIHTHLEFKCPFNHEIKMTFDHFKSGGGCGICYGKQKKEIDDIRNYLKKYNYELLSKEYKDSRSKLKILCPKGHEFEMTWDSFKFGYRCNICGGTLKKTIKEVKKYIESFNYKCLFNKYEGANELLKVKCPENHEFKISWSMFQQGQRCPVCFRIRNTGHGHWNWRGGISCEPYCDVWLDKEFKDSIKKRDGNKCLNPECNGIIKRLCLHHINYNKKDCRLENLITICLSCNTKANYDREWHEAWYQAIIHRRQYV